MNWGLAKMNYRVGWRQGGVNNGSGIASQRLFWPIIAPLGNSWTLYFRLGNPVLRGGNARLMAGGDVLFQNLCQMLAFFRFGRAYFRKGPTLGRCTPVAWRI
jgi:hypothetical protein